MSHQIEFEKAAFGFLIPANDPRFRHFSHRELIVLVVRTCANNVIPHSPSWDIVGVMQRQVCYDRVMLPQELWDLAREADGGLIKPHGRVCSGSAYLRQWREALRESRDGIRCPLRRFRISVPTEEESFPLSPLDLTEVDNLPGESPRWGKWRADRLALRAAFHALMRKSPENPRHERDVWVMPGNENFWHAIHLYINRRHLPFMVHFSG